MRPRLFDIPEEPAEIATWLDRGMVGVNLGEIIAELEAVHAGSNQVAPSGIDVVLGDQAAEVLERGLAVLPAPRVRALLRNPRLLLDLQERVLTEGSDYWAKLTREDAEVTKAAAQDWSAFETKAEVNTPAAPVAVPAERPATPASAPSPAPSTRPSYRFWLHAWARLATMAASLLALLYAVELFEREREKPKKPVPIVVNCGWNDDALLSDHVSTPEFLNHLADAAECVNLPKDSGEIFIKNLAEVRAGCTRLLFAIPRIRSLRTQADRDWLLENCRKWASDLDVAIRAIEEGVPLTNDQASAPEIVNQLIEALRSQAKSVGNEG